MAKRKIPEVLTPEEQDRLVGVLNSSGSTASNRNMVMVRLMLDAGLRSAEVLALRYRHIDWASGQLWVREGKGMKDRSLWLGPDLVALLKQYVEANPGEPASLIFRSRTGKPISSRYLRYMVKDLGEKAGLDKDLHPHTLRHSFATDLLRSTKNLRLVGKALGHSDKSLSVTAIYTHICDPEMEAAMKNLRQGG